MGGWVVGWLWLVEFQGRRTRTENSTGTNVVIVDLIHNNISYKLRNDHTIVTAPLPVCSAKLSTIGPG